MKDFSPGGGGFLLFGTGGFVDSRLLCHQCVQKTERVFLVKYSSLEKESVFESDCFLLNKPTWCTFVS